MLLKLPFGLRAQIASDLHLEGWLANQTSPPLHPNADAHVLILAGDLCNGIPNAQIAAWLAKRLDGCFWPLGIYMVLGNHDHYDLELDEAANDWREMLEALDLPVRVLHRDVAVLDAPGGKVRLAGCTYWTDFDRNDPLLPFYAEKIIADYKWIKTDGRPIRANDVLQAHERDRQWLLQLAPGTPDDPLVIVTHHAPSWRSVNPERKGDMLNGAYVSASEWIAEQLSPTVWVHGHVHARCDYWHGSTRIVSHPLGYCGERVPVGYVDQAPVAA